MDSIDIINATLSRQVEQFNSISNNIANANTNGFLGHAEFSELIHENGQIQNNSYVNISTSSSKSSSRSLDVALLDSGFFLISKGEEFYITRNGRFHINQEGELAHASGGLLVGKNGPILLTSDQVKIDGQGKVFQQGSMIDQIQVVNADSNRITAQGNSLYLTDTINLHSQPKLKQYSINTSNVDVSFETTRMIELSRSIQTMQKVNSAYERMMTLGVSELGRNK